MNPTEFQRIHKNLKESKESHRILCNSVLFQICFCLHTSKAPKVSFCFSKLCNVTWGDHIDVSLSVARLHRGLLVLYFVIVNSPVFNTNSGHLCKVFCSSAVLPKSRAGWKQVRRPLPAADIPLLPSQENPADFPAPFHHPGLVQFLPQHSDVV